MCVGISMHEIVFRPWLSMLPRVLSSGSRINPFKITVVVLSELIVYVWYSMLSVLHISLNSLKSITLLNIIFSLLHINFIWNEFIFIYFSVRPIV